MATGTERVPYGASEAYRVQERIVGSSRRRQVIWMTAWDRGTKNEWDRVD